MYKLEKRIIIKIILIFVVLMMLFSFKASLCALGLEEDYLGHRGPIIVSLNGNPKETETIFKYDIIPSSSNLSGASNEPTELTVSLNNVTDKVEEGRLSKTAYIDFSGTTYTKPGVYKYVIKEKYCSNEKEFPLSDQEYRVSVEVTKNPDQSLSHSFYKIAFDLNNNTKEERLTFNHNQMTYIKFKMNTTGRDADPNQYFRVTVTIFGREGEVYDITGQDATVTYNNQTIQTLDKFEVHDGQYSFDVYLKDGQTVYVGKKIEGGEEFYQIPVGTYVRIVENESPEYQTFINDEEGKVKRNFELSDNEDDNAIEFVNYADEEAAPTGVFFTILPYVIILVAVGLILIFIIYKKKKDKKVDENN